jgi:Kef-type K+ transport system membrane component KefB
VIAVFVLLALGGLMHAAGSFAGGAHPGGTELAFGFLLLSAFFTARLVTRIGLPRLTGYLAAGIVVGPQALGLVEKAMTAQLGLVGGCATAIIALNAGAELNLRAVRPLLPVVFRLAAFAVCGTMLLLAAALIALRSQIPFLAALPFDASLAVSGALAVALAAQSPAVVMALIVETGAEGPLTRTILASVIVADLVVIIAFGVASSVATAVIGGGIDLGAAIGSIAWEVFGSIGVGVFIGMVLGGFVRFVGKGVGLFAVMLCVLIAELGTALHFDPLIIALTAGLWLENASKADAHELLGGFEAASLPVYLVFFALAGVKLDLRALATLALPVGILVAVRATGFFVGGRLATSGPSVPPLVRRTAWIGLLPQAGLALALALLVRRTFPTFGDAAFALVVGVVATNELIAPVIFRLALVRSGEAGKRPPAGGPH